MSGSTPSSAGIGLGEQRLQARREQRQREQLTYQAAAILATAGIVSIATFATYYRIIWHADAEGAFPWLDLACTLLLAAGGATGMEAYAR